MKTTFLFTACVALLSSSALASAKCPNIEGTFFSPFENANSDSVTEITIQQYSCDSIFIVGTTLGKRFFESLYKSYHARFSLGGTPVTAARDCVNAYFGICGTYQATPLHIEKKLNAAALIEDTKHGLCTYTSTNLTKDRSGNLIETPQAECEDGFRGPVAPLVWKKASKTK